MVNATFFKRLFCFCAVILITGGVMSHVHAECVYQPKLSGLPEPVESKNSRNIRRGINLSQWWQDRQDRPLTQDDVRGLRNIGFDFVRLPISPAWLDIKDEAEQRKKIEALRCDIVMILNEDLRVIVDMHPSDTVQKYLSQNTAELIPVVEEDWRKMQAVLQGLPVSRVILQLWNEPLVETDLWWRMQDRMLQDLRKYFPDHTFVVSAGPFNGWWTMVEKKPYADQNLIYDFHFYDPMVFTHHGAAWLDAKHVATADSSITYPVETKFHFGEDQATQDYVAQGWRQSSITDIIQHVAAWRDYYQVSVICSEFGVYRAHVDDISRYTWLRDVRDALESKHLTWALWEYRGPFGLMDDHNEIDKGILDALRLGYQVKKIQ